MNRVAVFVALWLAGGCTDLDQLELESRGHHHDDRCGHHRDPVETLADAAARADRRIGTAVDYGPLTTEETYRTILATEFDYVTPGNETKWGSLQPVDPDHWSFERADAIVELATDAGQAIKGHTLVWHSQLRPGSTTR
ncbi:MAG: endo-1,4-beta-xylanase [Kofleriaceae bacterium]